MTTEYVFLGLFVFIIGYCFGKMFKSLNPLLIGFGLLLFYPLLLSTTKDFEDMYYITAFVVGFLINFKILLDRVSDILYDIKDAFLMKRQTQKANERLYRDKANIEEELQRQKREAEEDLRRQRTEAEDDLRRQQQNAEDTIKKRQKASEDGLEEKVKRAKEEFKQYRGAETDQENKTDYSNDPHSFSGSCEILGVSQGDSFDTMKRAYRRLMSMYHPDKVAGLSGGRRKQAEEEAKNLNIAWETIKKKLGRK